MISDCRGLESWLGFSREQTPEGVQTGTSEKTQQRKNEPVIPMPTNPPNPTWPVYIDGIWSHG